MHKNPIQEIIETFLDNKMPQDVQRHFLSWLRHPDSLEEKERALENYWNKLNSANGPDRKQKLARLHQAIQRSTTFRHQNLWRKIAAVAAVVLLAIGLNLFVVTDYLSSKVQTNIVTTAHDKGEYVLPDGTHIWLNAGSVLRYYGDLSGNKRVVELNGEAFFRVHHDKQRPFILKTNDMNIEVLGTEFDVINYDEFGTTEAILCNGSIRAYGGKLSQSIILKPGERLVYAKNTGRITLSQVATQNYSQWMNEEMSFNNAPLSDILINLQRWYAIEIDYPHEWAQQVRMSFAMIRNENIDEILKAMSQVVTIDFVHQGRRVTIIPREKKR